jgi:hypothetical protein
MMQFGLLGRVTKTSGAFLSRVILKRSEPEVGLYDLHQIGSENARANEQWIRNCTQFLLHPNRIKPLLFIA